MNKIKVVISGLIYPVTMLHYFWEAFEQRDDVDLCVTGPFYGDYIPWNGGMNLPMKYVKIPDIPLPQTAANMRPSPVISQLQMKKWDWHDTDLWIQIDAGFHFSERPHAKVVAHVQTDPHVLKDFYRIPKAYSDVVFCMQTPYIEGGEHYLPYGFSPRLHYPMELEKTYDVCMIGLQYETRVNLAQTLRALNLKVMSGIGIVYDEYREAYNQSRIAVSWSSLQDTPTRVFEAMGMGLPLVCNRTPDLNNFFVEHEHYLGFGNETEAVQQILFLLSNPEIAENVAQNAYRKALAGHTWDHRINQLLEVCKLK